MNRLITAVTPSGTITYTYDPFDRRETKDVDGVVTRYIYDNNEVLVEYDGSGEFLRKFVYGAGIDQPVAMITPGVPPQGDQWHYYATDAQGSVVALNNGGHTIEETYRYTAYGQPETPSALGNPYLYTARRYDTETGLYYYRARYYDPNLRRFIQPDPIGYLGGMNLYAYVGNSPVNWVDPWGLIKWKAVGQGFFATLGGRLMISYGASLSTTGEGAVIGVPTVIGGVVLSSWGFSQMITGFLDADIGIPKPSVAALGALVTTGDVEIAKAADTVEDIIFLVPGVGKIATNPTASLEAIGTLAGLCEQYFNFLPESTSGNLNCKPHGHCPIKDTGGWFKR